MNINKKKTFLIVFLFVALLGFVFSAQAATQKMTYIAWVPYWSKTAAVPETIAHLDQLTEISPFAYSVSATGTLIDTMKVGQEPWPALFKAARAKKVKILPSILWTDGVSINAVLSNKATRESHIKAILKTVADNKYDGIDIDYENKFASTSASFSIFITDLSKQLHAKNKFLACTIESRTPPTSKYLVVPTVIEYANDFKVLNNYCDEVRLMTYDQGTADIKLNNLKRRGGLYMPVADIDWVRKVMWLAEETINPQKLVLGVANYGYEYEITDKKAYYDYKKLRSLSYQNAIELANKVKAKIIRNSAGELSFTYASSSSSRLVWLSDSRAIADKVNTAKAFGMRGVALFRVDGLSDPFLWSVLK